MGLFGSKCKKKKERTCYYGDCINSIDKQPVLDYQHVSIYCDIHRCSFQTYSEFENTIARCSDPVMDDEFYYCLDHCKSYGLINT